MPTSGSLTAGHLLALIREVGAGASSGGRPPTALTFDETSRVVLVADLGATHGRIAVTDLARRPPAEASEEMPIDRGPQEVLDFVTAVDARLAATPAISRASTGE